MRIPSYIIAVIFFLNSFNNLSAQPIAAGKINNQLVYSFADKDAKGVFTGLSAEIGLDYDYQSVELVFGYYFPKTIATQDYREDSNGNFRLQILMKSFSFLRWAYTADIILLVIGEALLGYFSQEGRNLSG